MPKKRQCQSAERQSGRVIGLADIQTAFYLAALGLGLAAVALGSERFFHCLRTSPRWTKRSNRQRGNEQGVTSLGTL